MKFSKNCKHGLIGQVNRVDSKSFGDDETNRKGTVIAHLYFDVKQTHPVTSRSLTYSK